MTNLYNVSTHKEIDEFVQEYFGSIAGFAQQYLFYAIREGFLKVEEPEFACCVLRKT